MVRMGCIVDYKSVLIRHDGQELQLLCERDIYPLGAVLLFTRDPGKKKKKKKAKRNIMVCTFH